MARLSPVREKNLPAGLHLETLAVRAAVDK